jgi:hypothetical protein
MGRRTFVAVLGAVLIASTWVGVSEAAAAKVPVAATGSLQCSLRGTVKYNPPLGTNVVSTTASIKAKLSCRGAGTGSTPAVNAGKLVASSTAVGMSCTVRNIAEVNGSIAWKARGAKVVPTAVHLGAQASAASYRFATSAIAAGSSYENSAMVLNGTLSSPPCGRKGIKKSTIGGTVDVSQNCDTNVLTTQGFTYDANDEWFWVVVPFCDYLPQHHPTGTLTITYPGLPACTVSGPLVDSGMNAASSSFDPWGNPKPYTYWGIDSGLTYQQQIAMCGNATGRPAYTYSGDSRYRGYTEPLP